MKSHWASIPDHPPLKGLTDTTNVTIVMSDANDPPVAFGPDKTQTLTIVENTMGGGPGYVSSNNMLQVSDTDVDSVVNPAWGRLQYVISGTLASYFNTSYVNKDRHDHYQANITNILKLNYEETSGFDLTVDVTDGGGLMDAITVSVVVENANDKPYFTGCPFGAAVLEAADKCQAIASLVADDEDAETLTTDPTVISWSTLTYSLSRITCPHCTEDNDLSSYFTVDSSTGTVAKGKAGDFDGVNGETFFQMVVNATDGGNLTDSCILKVNVTESNENPSMDEMNCTVRENVTGVVSIGTLHVYDDSTGITLAIDSCTAIPTGSSCGATRSSMFFLGPVSVGAYDDDTELYLYTADLRVNTSLYDPNYEDNIFNGKRAVYMLGISAVDNDKQAPLFTETEVRFPQQPRYMLRTCHGCPRT